MGNRLVLIIFLVMALWLPPVVMAQDPGDQPPPDDYTPPPGLDYSGLANLTPAESGLPVFEAYSGANLASSTIVLAQNVGGLTFRIRTCPTVEQWCAANVYNYTIGYFYQDTWQFIDQDQCVLNGQYKWCYMPDFDNDPNDDILVGWVSVGYANRHLSWVSWRP